jgi:hypothetical protein
MVTSPCETVWTSFILGVNVDNELIFRKPNGRVWRGRFSLDMKGWRRYAIRALAPRSVIADAVNKQTSIGVPAGINADLSNA